MIVFFLVVSDQPNYSESRPFDWRKTMQVRAKQIGIHRRKEKVS